MKMTKRSRYKQRRTLQTRLFIFSVIAILSCLSIINPFTRLSTSINSQDSSSTQCLLKQAVASGSFQIVSHKSFVDMTSPDQPKSCTDALKELKHIGVTRIDLDAILDMNDTAEPRIVIGHPMEYKRELKSEKDYSPCSNTSFDDMIHVLKSVYGSDFFISIEPKAAWHNTKKEQQDPALTNKPSDILKYLLESLQRHRLKKDNCAVIVELFDEHDSDEKEEEKAVLDQLLEHCSFYKGIRLSDKIPTSMEEYDVYMPTIEFHPNHSHNRGAHFPSDLAHNSLFWIVDDINDLRLAAELRAKGIVSNVPKKILEIVRNDPAWCPGTS